MDGFLKKKVLAVGGWWSVLVDISWLVMGGGEYILAGGGSWWVVVDIYWIVVGGGGGWSWVVA